MLIYIKLILPLLKDALIVFFLVYYSLHVKKDKIPEKKNRSLGLWLERNLVEFIIFLVLVPDMITTIKSLTKLLM